MLGGEGGGGGGGACFATGTKRSCCLGSVFGLSAVCVLLYCCIGGEKEPADEMEQRDLVQFARNTSIMQSVFVCASGARCRLDTGVGIERLLFIAWRCSVGCSESCIPGTQP